MAVQYEGRIDHTEDSIHALFRTQYNTYCLGRVVLTAVAGVALIAAGLFAALPLWAQGLLLLAGCLLFAGRDLPATLRELRDRGVTCLAAALYRSRPLDEAGRDFPGGVCVVIGSEGPGGTCPPPCGRKTPWKPGAGRCPRTYAPSVPGIWNCARGMPTKNCVMTVWTVWWRTGSICISFSGLTRW